MLTGDEIKTLPPPVYLVSDTVVALLYDPAWHGDDPIFGRYRILDEVPPHVRFPDDFAGTIVAEAYPFTTV